MQLEQQVVSLELAKRLKELGFEQNGVFGYYKKNDEIVVAMNPEIDIWYDGQDIGELICSAYTVAELGEKLPKRIRFNGKTGKLLKYSQGVHLFFSDDGSRCYVNYTGGARMYDNHATLGDTEANARAEMLIYLKENNII